MLYLIRQTFLSANYVETCCYTEWTPDNWSGNKQPIVVEQVLFVR